MDPSHAAELLSQLNELEQKYGRALAERDPNYDVPGEVQARVALLKAELESLGIEIAWDGQQYQRVHRATL